jgi:hypothetical protein
MCSGTCTKKVFQWKNAFSSFKCLICDFSTKNFYFTTVSGSESVSESELFSEFEFGSGQNLRICYLKKKNFYFTTVSGSESVSESELFSGFGFGSGQNLRILSDSDPQHCMKGKFEKFHSKKLYCCFYIKNTLLLYTHSWKIEKMKRREKKNT